VRLLRTSSDDASVFELVGRGTPHPGLVDLTARARPRAPGLSFVTVDPQAPGDAAELYETAPTQRGAVTFSWSWDAPAPVVQVSVGSAASVDGSTEAVTVDLRDPAGGWRRLASVNGGVGQPGGAPFVLVRPAAPVLATGLRVTVHATGTAAVVDVHALGEG
jgi:hypothetical protein